MDRTIGTPRRNFRKACRSIHPLGHVAGTKCGKSPVYARFAVAASGETKREHLD